MGSQLKSIYNKSSYANAISPANMGQYGIAFKVNPFYGINGTTDDAANIVTVTGILKNAISWSVPANWQTLGLEDIISSIAASNPLLGAIDKGFEVVNTAAGKSFNNSGLFTRKFYKNSGDLTINPSFRVFDFNNQGLPMAAGMLFTSLCLPKKINADAIDVQEGAQKGLNALLSATAVIDSVAKTDTTNTTQNLGNMAVTNLKGATLNWTVSPTTVDVEIGTWLKLKKLVLTNVSVSYSFEMTNAGPLYADFDLTLATRENLTFNETGNIDQIEMSTPNVARGSSRVSYGVI